MNKITKEQQKVICNQSMFCNGCEHSQEHTKHEMAFPDDCNKSLCYHYGKYAECVTPENVISETEKMTTEQLEQILERVEDGMTTQDDADALKKILTGSVWCEWKFETVDYYETECGGAWQFFEGDVVENNCKFCPFCGRQIIQLDMLSEDCQE